MKTIRICSLAAILIASGQFSNLSAQGVLNPPGPPGPTMKSLDELDAKLEKRVPISSLPFTINQPGSYYLTGNLEFTAATGNAISISASNVTVDLNGFALSSTSAVTGSAIAVSSSTRNIAVRNGTITGTTTVFIGGSPLSWTVTPGGFSNGVLSSAANSQFSHLRISRCRERGIIADFEPLVDRVTANENGLHGIAAAGTVVNCVAARNGGSGFIAATSVSNCTAADNGNTGIAGGAVTNSYAYGNGSDGIASTGVIAFSRATNNNRKNNGSVDIFAPGATRTGNNPAP